MPNPSPNRPTPHGDARRGALALALVLALLANGAAPASGQAPPRPTQLLFEPLPTAPLDGLGRDALGLSASSYRLPGDRRAHRYRLDLWLPVGESHSVRPWLDYAGLESGDRAEMGGGGAGVQWSSHFAGAARGGVAADLAVGLPLGDADKYPVSTRAPWAQFRLRWSPLGGPAGRLWLGWWARRVSPPEDATYADRYYPSGSGVDLVTKLSRGRWYGELHARQDLGGLPDTLLLQLRVGFSPSPRFRLWAGAAVAPGPAADRPFEDAVQLGLRFGRRAPRGAAPEAAR